MSKKYFEIVALSDCADCNKKLRDENSMNPVDVILGGVSIIRSILGLFGGSRRLTSQDWQKAFPANGYWTNKLRADLASHITWDTDWGNVPLYTKYFVDRNTQEICGKMNYPRNFDLPSNEWNICLNKFYQLLQDEAKGISTNGKYQAGLFGSDSLIPILLLGGLAIAFLSTPSKRRSK